jgi:hypothetical protein
MTIQQHLNTTAQQYDNSTHKNNMTIHQYHNISHNMYVHCTFISIKTFMIRLENLHGVRIDNIRSASDHGMNNICKLVIEFETLAVFAWWTQKEFPR